MPRRDVQAAIAARQKRELFMEQFTAAQTADDRQRQRVNWGAKGEAVAERQDLHRHLDEVQADHRDALVERRRRLAALLLSEKEEHDRLLSGLTETDEQRRERIIRKAKELRAEREAARQADTAARNDRLFRERIDCLRQAESRLKVMQVTDARYDQLALAEQRRAEQAQEDAYFAQQAAEAQRLATERTQKDLETQYLRTQRLTADLGAQVEGNAARKAAAAEAQRQDDAEFRRLVHEDEVQEAQRQLERRVAREKLSQEMKDLNEELQRARREEFDRLRREDRELLDSILAEIAEQQRLEQEEKHAKTQQRHEQWKDLQEQLAQKKEDGHALDRLWQEANAREWEKREARWRADKDRRDALMRSILIVRRQQVLEKRQQERDDAGARQREHAQFLEDLARDSGTEEEAERLRASRRKENQQYLDAQIAQRREEKERELAEKQQELTAQGALEQQYDARIQQEMANLEAAKPSRFSAIPLLPPKQRNRPF